MSAPLNQQLTATLCLSLMLAGLTPPALPTPTDFGTDLACTADLDPNGRTVSGQRLVAEAIYRRLITPRGRLIDDPNYGFDVSSLVNDDTSDSGIAQIVAGVSAECRKDERVIAVGVQQSFLGGVLTLAIALHTALGPFSLVLAVTAVTVDLLRAPS